MRYVVYIGVFFMPDKNAAAQRAKSFSKMIKELDYIPVIIGMNKDKKKRSILDTQIIRNQVYYYEMEYPRGKIDWFKMLFNINPILEVIEYLGIDNIKAIICMDYFSPALLKVISFCKRYNIRFIADAVDWFEKSNYSFPKNFIKNFDTWIRMRYIYRKINYLITISSFLKEYYKSSVKNISEIPGVFGTNIIANKMEIYKSNRKYLHLAFVGSPGNKCEKEKIDWVIKAVCKINKERKKEEKKIKFTIAGISKKTIETYRPDLSELDYFNDSIIFLGRITHNECKKLIASSDFSVIVRDNTLLSKAGFPTKLGESFACGTPVFVTPTSNIIDFIPNKYGVIADDCSYDMVEKSLQFILTLSDSEIMEMHKIVSVANPLYCLEFLSEMKRVLD